ncbi:unnamed protein product, partial [Choristocarpus tenellus]
QVDNKTHPVAARSKLPEVFALLDSKVTHMMKAVSAALVKDDRSATGAGSSGGFAGTATSSSVGTSLVGGGSGASPAGDATSKDMQSQFHKLDNASVNKVLYQNIMSTEPDTSPRNVRVSPHKPKDANLAKRMQMKILLGPEYVSEDEGPDSEENSEEEEEDARDTFVDRTTVKKLSNLVLGKDTRSRGSRRRKLRLNDS